MRRIRKVQLLLGMVGTLPVLVAAVCVANEVRLREIRSHGEVVEGTVVGGGESESATGRMSHYLVVEFSTEFGGEQVRRFLVDEDDFVMANQTSTVPVTFIRSDPGFSRVGTQFRYDRRPVYFSAVVFGLIVAMIAALEVLARKRRGAKLLIQG